MVALRAPPTLADAPWMRHPLSVESPLPLLDDFPWLSPPERRRIWKMFDAAKTSMSEWSRPCLLYTSQGKAYFRKKQKVTSTILTLSPGQGILRARLSLSGQQLVKKIEIRSIDETNGKQIKGEAALSLSLIHISADCPASSGNYRTLCTAGTDGTQIIGVDHSRSVYIAAKEGSAI